MDGETKSNLIESVNSMLFLFCFFVEGLKVPSAKWKEILDEANHKTTKLLNDYEDTCIHRKVRCLKFVNNFEYALACI